MRIILLLVLVLTCLHSFVFAKEPHNQATNVQIVRTPSEPEVERVNKGWVIARGRVVIANITPTEAKRKAVKDAERKAVEFVSGVEVKTNSVDLSASNGNEILLDSFFEMTELTTSGFVLEKEILVDKVISENNVLVQYIELKVKVGKQKGVKDPSFVLHAELNKDYLKEGEELELMVNSTKDCYLTILNVCSNDSVYVIFPNTYRDDNKVNAGEPFYLPNAEDRAISLIFPVYLLPGKTSDVEILKIIATKNKIDFTSSSDFTAYGTHKAALTDLRRWMLKIPRDQIAESALQYHIRK